ncbi:hypothetical protein [Oxalobacter paraformigenes]|uniref:Uncharacterized protein n=1 Tax=Oxalobacter paraformigenes TaxID=556268 RepID=T5LUJ7_9BURK|nr:hypothetical protein [Oxalobacter paraformigenes]EQM95163.1 hypothetical protein OFAG_02259 [Oxalobacter paraformigenes]
MGSFEKRGFIKQSGMHVYLLTDRLDEIRLELTSNREGTQFLFTKEDADFMRGFGKALIEAADYLKTVKAPQEKRLEEILDEI